MKKLIFSIISFISIQCIAAPYPASWSADATTGAAMGYCLAKHPYQTIHKGTFTPDGYEIVASPGIVGAVRRNYVYNRRIADNDEGINNSCKQACAQFGKPYNPTYRGVPLRQKVASGAVITSGIGDMGALVLPDRDYYLFPTTDETTTAGIASRGNTWHESDVAQADYCCCQVK